MSLKLNWTRIKRLHTDLESSGFEDNDKLLFVLIEKKGKVRKAVIRFKELYRFCWDMIDSDNLKILTFFIQDIDGRIIYRHRQMIGNEEVSNCGHTDVISMWNAFTDEEKNTYLTLLIAQINAYEK